MPIPFNRLDLNLLRVFDAVMEERSVLRAGQRLCVSQSAVSHALARLRDVLGDDLFVRTPTGMQPTARALSMAPWIREAWRSLDAAIGLPKFEPASSGRRFTIAVSDFVTMLMMPYLLDLFRREAPLVDLLVRPDSQIDIAEQIDLGLVDVAIGSFGGVPARFRSRSLFVYDDVLLSNKSQSSKRLSLEEFSRLSIVTVSLHGQQEGVVDGFVSRQGLSRRSDMYDRLAFERAFSGSQRSPRIALSLPHFLALPALLQHGDLTAIVPRPLGKALARMHALSIHELPYKTSSVHVSALWHERNANDETQEWLLGMLLRASENLRAPLADVASPPLPVQCSHRTSEAISLPRARDARHHPHRVDAFLTDGAHSE
jgi:DNA-binding transcriptional LysR family regulator